MRIIFEIGLEPFYLLNKYGGVLLFLIIASLSLAPLASFYVFLAVTSNLMTGATSDGEKCESMAVALRAVQVCAEATLYYTLSFPFILGLLSTHMSYRMAQGRLGSERPGISDTELEKKLKHNTMQLRLEDMEEDSSKSNHHSSQRLLIPLPGVPINDAAGEVEEKRRVPGDCSICLRTYESGEKVVWSSNVDCTHVFHLDCIKTWMSPWQATNRSCPCCRQSFLGDTTPRSSSDQMASAFRQILQVPSFD